MASALFFLCLLIVSLNISLDCRRSRAQWERVLPLVSLRGMIEDVSDLMSRRTDAGRTQREASAHQDGNHRVTTTSLTMLNGAALVSAGVNLLQREETGPHLLILNAVCSWIARKANDAPRQEAQQNNRSRPATDIIAALVSHVALFALSTPGCNVDIFTKAAIFTIWFLPLGAALAVLPVTEQPNDWMRPFNYALQVIWLSVAWFIAISDLSVEAMIHNPIWFGGLHQMQGVAVGTHHAAFLFLAIGRQYPRGDRSWPYAMIAALWLGLVALYDHLPPLSIPQGPQCIALGQPKT